MMESMKSAMNSFSTSIESLQQDMIEIRDFFVSIKNIILGVFGFMGQETAILVFLTLLLLFVINLIPFLFFDKRFRYFLGIGCGIAAGIYFGYTWISIAKFVFIMLLPILFERLIAFMFLKVGKLMAKGIKCIPVSVKRLSLLKSSQSKNKTENPDSKV